MRAVGRGSICEMAAPECQFCCGSVTTVAAVSRQSAQTKAFKLRQLTDVSRCNLQHHFHATSTGGLCVCPDPRPGPTLAWQRSRYGAVDMHSLTFLWYRCADAQKHFLAALR